MTKPKPNGTKVKHLNHHIFSTACDIADLTSNTIRSRNPRDIVNNLLDIHEKAIAIKDAAIELQQIRLMHKK